MSLRDDLERGRAAEGTVVAAFEADFAIRRATPEEDRAGVDYWFERAGRTYGVQIKADWRAAETNNLFIETVSVDARHVPGWAQGSRADMLLYYVPPRGLLYVIPMHFVVRHIDRWRRRYPERATRPELNDGYRTHGICVPVGEFEGCGKLHLEPGG